MEKKAPHKKTGEKLKMLFDLIFFAQLFALTFAFEDPCTHNECPPGSQDFYFGCLLNCDHGYIDEGLLCRKKGSIKTITKSNVNSIEVKRADCSNLIDFGDAPN